MGRDDLRELMGVLSEPEIADGLLVHAGFHFRLDDEEVEAGSPDDLGEGQGMPTASSDFFLTVDFGDSRRYRRQVLVVFQRESAMVSVSSDDEAWMKAVLDSVERFVALRRAWFRSRLLLQRVLLIAGMAAVTVSAALSRLSGDQFAWTSLWLFLVGIVGVAASYILPQAVPHSLVRLDTANEPSPTRGERLAVGISLLAVSITFVGFGVALLLAVAGD
jgi:hypothetical protein